MLVKLADLGDDPGEDFGIGFGEHCEHFGVERYAFFVGGTDKLGVRELFINQAQAGVDADVKEAAVVVLFVAAVGKRVLARVEDSLARLALFGRAAKAVSLGHRQDILAALI